MSVAMSLNPKRVTCKRYGRKLVKTRTVFGVLDCEHYVLENCGLYEASDLLLGDPLCMKSDAVKWINVSMPHKRNRRLQNYKKLIALAESDPNNEAIFEQNLIENYYPQRPKHLHKVCLYDFVANYNWYGLIKKVTEIIQNSPNPGFPITKFMILKKRTKLKTTTIHCLFHSEMRAV